MGKKRSKKRDSIKKLHKTVWNNNTWNVCEGELRRGRGRPTNNLFEIMAEKIPFEAIDAVSKDLKKNDKSHNGVYVAHDSMGYARYIGRGDVFTRLKSRKTAHNLELQYFSFYIVADKKHEREIETLLIRAGGPHLHFNERKKRDDIQPGNVKDFEAGTHFYERQYKRGRPKRKKRGRPKNRK